MLINIRLAVYTLSRVLSAFRIAKEIEECREDIRFKNM